MTVDLFSEGGVLCVNTAQAKLTNSDRIWGQNLSRDETFTKFRPRKLLL